MSLAEQCHFLSYICLLCLIGSPTCLLSGLVSFEVSSGSGSSGSVDIAIGVVLDEHSKGP